MDDRTIDLIFAGSLDNLPPVSSKIVRIFTSSTFTDTTMERNTLMAKCYPKIKDYCREKHGLEFQVVDMRWGVRDEATDDHMTTELCMKEIQNCQRLSMGPNFVVFLGQKYGYRPIPTYILSSELQMIRDDLSATGHDPILIDTWYKKDANAVPPISVLQPISSILVNFNNKRVPKLQAEDQAQWWDILCKFQKMFRKAATSLQQQGKMDIDSVHNYYMSVTEREVINGVLNVRNTKNHTLAYIRYINNINLQNIRKASLFVDILNRSLDSESSKLLANLRDERLPNKIETTNIEKYSVEWIGREGLAPETHNDYLKHFVAHFYKHIVKLVDRAMRKEDSSAQGQIITEILQHLHACNNSVKVFYGRADGLERIHQYMLNTSNKPLVLYGVGGCGKTSLLARSASLSTGTEWFKKTGGKPLAIIRFLGTTPDSSALTPTLISICQQISYNFLLPFDGIPDDIVPLTAHFKYLLTLATKQQPLLLFLDSVDQLTGTQDKVSWLPTRLPPYCKIIVSCVNEEHNPDVSKEYHILKRLIDLDENFIEIEALGDELAMHILRQWMSTAHRDLNNYQWRLVSNAIELCSLPIFVKLVFAEICRWRSYTKTHETHLAATVMDSIMMLFERIEKQHGRILVFHALAYITAAKSGLSESELEDLISLDDKVLDDVYQYHMPPVRRIPPLLWTRIRNDLPNYLSEREADGVSVMNWYHRQFRDAARERYFKNMNMSMYFHSMIADYFLGIWGGGASKPFRYTEIQRHRFNLTDKEGAADRKVPLQPLVFHAKNGTISRYNLRKFGELAFHLVRSNRIKDLYENVLFNYEWLHAKLSSCPLQAVLADYEDAIGHIEEKRAKRELMLVADALRLGGAVLTHYPDMLAPQLIGRLLPEIEQNINIKMLLNDCDRKGPNHCALLPVYHCLHTPGGPLKYSLEGHQFAVFAICLTSDFRYVVSISNRFIIWDLSTSDLTRDINPNIEGIMQQLVLSPDNKWAATFTSNNQAILLNMISTEFTIINHPLANPNQLITGVYLLNHTLYIYGSTEWSEFDMHGNKMAQFESPQIEKSEKKWQILQMEFDPNWHSIIFWTGDLDNSQMLLYISADKISTNSNYITIEFQYAIALKRNHKVLFTVSSSTSENCTVCCYIRNDLNENWNFQQNLNGLKDEFVVLQLKLDLEEVTLFGTTSNGFIIWNLEEREKDGILLQLPYGTRNITTKMLQSNSIMLSGEKDYAVAGVRKNLYVWSMSNGILVKILDAHFARIIQLEPLTIGHWNSVVTSSIDRTVKVWNINNIFEQVHHIDRHELQIDSIDLSNSLSATVTATRNSVGVWDLRYGKLLAKLTDSPLGAIVTHAKISRNGRYIITAESGHLLIWLKATGKVVFKIEQIEIQQVLLIENEENDVKVLTICKTTTHSNQFPTIDFGRFLAIGTVRLVPSGQDLYSFEYPMRNAIGTAFRMVLLTTDHLNLIVTAVDKMNHDCLYNFDASDGTLLCKISLKMNGIKDVVRIVTVCEQKPNLIAVLAHDRAAIIDVKTKRTLKIVRKWGGAITKDGKLGLYSPPRGGLELLELRKGNVIRTFIPKVAEGVFNIMSLFTTNDQYVLYYHSGRRTLRVFRTEDGQMLANYRVQAELTAIECTRDGKALVLGTIDGCISVVAIADLCKNNLGDYLEKMPSRDEKWKEKMRKLQLLRKFKAVAHIAILSQKLVHK